MPQLQDPKIITSIYLPNTLMTKIQDYKEDNDKSSFNQAVEELVNKGLGAE